MMKLKKSKMRKFSTITLHLLHLLFFVGLLWIYSIYVVVIYEYMGFKNEFNFGNLLISVILLSVSSFMIRKPGLPSHFFLHLCLALTITPSLVLFCGSNLPIEFVLTTISAFWLMVITANTIHVPRLHTIHINTVKIFTVLSIVVALFIGSIFLFEGGRYLNFNLSAVYKFRQDAAANLPSIYGYLSSITGKIFIPFGIVLSLLYKRWLMLAFWGSASVLLFALTSHKAPLFYPIFVIFVYFVFQKKNALNYFLIALIGVVMVGALDFWIYSQGYGRLSGWFGSLFLRRALLIPSLLNWFYFDFFSTNPHYLWSQSKFSLGLTESPFELNFVNLIGREYFGREEISANTGWIGSGYANAGLFGVYLYSIIIGAFFSFLNAYAKKIETPLVISFFTIPVMVMLRSTDLPNMLLTHGLVVSIAILFIFRPQAVKMVRFNEGEKL